MTTTSNQVQPAADSALTVTPSAASTRHLRRKCACGEAAGVSGSCSSCDRKARFDLGPTLKVGPPNDHYEQEADRIADEVLATSAPAAVNARETRAASGANQETVSRHRLRRQPLEDEEELLQTKPLPGAELRRQPLEEEEELLQPKPLPGAELRRQPLEEEEELLQTKPLPGTELRRQPLEEEEELLQPKPLPGTELRRQPLEEEEELLQPKPLPGAELRRQPLEEEEELLQPKRTAGPATAGADFRGRLAAETPNGVPLSRDTRAFFEPRFGRDLGAVRVHRGQQAGALSRDISARAFTRGQHVFFGPGEHRPTSTEGRRLIAHELVHTLQNAEAGSAPIRRECVAQSVCNAPIAGSAFQFIAESDADEAPARQQRRSATPAAASSDQHGLHATSMERIFERFRPSDRREVHGVIIDADMSDDLGASTWGCDLWADESLPPGAPARTDLESATQPCVFMPVEDEREAAAFIRGPSTQTIDGMTPVEWLTDALSALVHEVAHVTFDRGLEGSATRRPAGVNSPTCSFDDERVSDEMSEIAALLSELPVYVRSAAREGSSNGPMQRALDEHMVWLANNGEEDLVGTTLGIGCRCDCDETRAMFQAVVDSVTAGWTPQEMASLQRLMQIRSSFLSRREGAL